jgi:hypothetical protein
LANSEQAHRPRALEHGVPGISVRYSRLMTRLLISTGHSLKTVLVAAIGGDLVLGRRTPCSSNCNSI